MAEFKDALDTRLKASFPVLLVSERRGLPFISNDPGSGTITYAVEYLPSGAGNPRLLSVVVDIDVYTRGPDTTLADSIAAAVETTLTNWTPVTDGQGMVRLTYFQRMSMEDPETKLAHTTLRFTGRAFRRME